MEEYETVEDVLIRQNARIIGNLEAVKTLLIWILVVLLAPLIIVVLTLAIR